MKIDKPLKELTPEEEKIIIDELNVSLVDFLPAAPNVEIGDTADGFFTKLRAQHNENGFSIFEIIFELQWRLYIHKKKYPDTNKLIVSDLAMTAILPDTAFRRGIMIKFKFE